jgi:hypothetical protein
MTLGLITETTVTAYGMRVGHYVESNTAARGYRRTQVWSRQIEWPSTISDDRVLIYAEARLEQMGLRPLAWWFFDDGVRSWYSCLEWIPGSTGTWRD